MFSPDGPRLASASRDETVRLWNGVTGAVVSELRAHSDLVKSVMFSPDGSRLASTTSDKTVRLRDGVSGVFVAQYESSSIPHVFQLDTEVGVPINPTFECKSNILGDNVDNSAILHTSSHRIHSVQLEFNQDANCYALLGLWVKADQTFSTLSLCWLPPGLGQGKVAQNGMRAALGLSDGRVFIFSTDRLKLS